MNASGARQNVAESGPVRPAGRATTLVSMTGPRGFETGIALQTPRKVKALLPRARRTWRRLLHLHSLAKDKLSQQLLTV